jgi:hypothetical protein
VSRRRVYSRRCESRIPPPFRLIFAVAPLSSAAIGRNSNSNVQRSGPELELPSDAEVDKVVSFLEKVWRRLVEMGRNVQRDVDPRAVLINPECIDVERLPAIQDQLRQAKAASQRSRYRADVPNCRAQVPEPSRVSRSQFAVALRQQVSPTITLPEPRLHGPCQRVTWPGRPAHHHRSLLGSPSSARKFH